MQGHPHGLRGAIDLRDPEVLLTGDDDELDLDYRLLAGGLALLLSRSNERSVELDFAASLQAYISLRSQLKSRAPVFLSAQVLMDLSHEIAQLADGATRRRPGAAWPAACRPAHALPPECRRFPATDRRVAAAGPTQWSNRRKRQNPRQEGMPVNIVDAIRRFNAGRDPERLAMKYRNLRASPSLFLRGTCHLFYARLPREKILAASPAVWVCGDLHFENFGSYKGTNRLVYFDTNDFDEALLAPAAWDILRLLASVLVARRALHLKRGQAERLCEAVIDAYGLALATGKAGWIDRDTADGPVQQLLAGLRDRKMAAFVARRTTISGGLRSIRCDGEHALAATDDQKRQVASLIAKSAAGADRPEFFTVLDAARRIAGTGSLGAERYVVLVKGNGSPDGNHLLDLKLAPRSSLDGAVRPKQPAWRSQAHRVVELHQRLQAVAPAFLHPIVAGKASYVLRELQPSEDRITVADQGAATDKVLRQMGQLAAWAQLRSSGRQGSASADELIAFGAARNKWSGDLMRAARLCAEQVEKDWRTWCLAYDKHPAWARSLEGPALMA